MARCINWNGTTDEALALLQALREHCACRVEAGRTVAVCPGHRMLVRDQRAVDGLLFMRRMAARLLVEEFSVGTHADRTSPLEDLVDRERLLGGKRLPDGERRGVVVEGV